MPHSNQTTITNVTSHSGVISTGSLNTLVNGLNLGFLTSIHHCPRHGTNAIVHIVAPRGAMTNGLLNSRIFDICACGAVVVTGSFNTYTG